MTGEEFKEGALRKMDAARTLVANSHWYEACLDMGGALEFALKAATCKVLKLRKYPEGKVKPYLTESISEWFKTHHLDRLLLLSGIFEAATDANSEIFTSWSLVRTVFVNPMWRAMDYSPSEFGESQANNLLKALCGNDEKESGIITYLENNQLW